MRWEHSPVPWERAEHCSCACSSVRYPSRASANDWTMLILKSRTEETILQQHAEGRVPGVR